MHKGIVLYQPLRTETLQDYNGRKGRMVLWHYSYMNAVQHESLFSCQKNLIMCSHGAIWWRVKCSDILDNMIQLRHIMYLLLDLALGFYISKAALWLREETSHPFLPEN